MKTMVLAQRPVCRAAVEQYAAALSEAGIPVRLTDVEDSPAVAVQWGPSQSPREGERDDGRFDDGSQPDDEEQQGADDDPSLGRLVSHYTRTLELLAGDAELAAAWLEDI